jgi:uncharacterized protein (DUF433 family)
MDWNLHIENNPAVMFGKPVIKGTRIPVSLIHEKLGHGISEEDLLKAYPRLTLDGIRASQLYAMGDDPLVKKDIEEITADFVHIDKEFFDSNFEQ